MIRKVFLASAAACALAAPLGCGGRTPVITGGERGSTLSEIESGARVQRAWVGATTALATGDAPVVATFDLLGGSNVELEVATTDSAPLDFELWRVRRDGTATLESPVDSPSGFSLQRIAAEEDATWALRFASGAPDQVLVYMECASSLHACTPKRQPGETCPPGFDCDQGLECEQGVCREPSRGTPE